LERHRSILIVSILSAFALAVGGCGGTNPDPDEVLDRALTRSNLAGFASGQGGGTVSVEALGYEDRVLESKELRVPRYVMAELGDALGSSGGLRGLVDEVELEGTEEVDGTETDHLSGDLGSGELAEAMRKAGAGGEVAELAGADDPAEFDSSLAGAGFDMYVGKDDGVIRRLDLTLAFDDPDNALPPTRIRFSLTPGTTPATE
jgi:hypothetical protein